VCVRAYVRACVRVVRACANDRVYVLENSLYTRKDYIFLPEKYFAARLSPRGDKCRIFFFVFFCTFLFFRKAKSRDLRIHKMRKEKKRKNVVWKNMIREHSCFATIAINISAKHVLQILH